MEERILIETSGPGRTAYCHVVAQSRYPHRKSPRRLPGDKQDFLSGQKPASSTSESDESLYATAKPVAWGRRLSSLENVDIHVHYVYTLKSYYTTRNDKLLPSAKSCIVYGNNEHAFTEKSGISVKGFVEFLAVYLRSMLVGWDSGMLIKEGGIRVGSCVEPILSEF